MGLKIGFLSRFKKGLKMCQNKLLNRFKSNINLALAALIALHLNLY